MEEEWGFFVETDEMSMGTPIKKIQVNTSLPTIPENSRIAYVGYVNSIVYNETFNNLYELKEIKGQITHVFLIKHLSFNNQMLNCFVILITIRLIAFWI